MPALTWQVTVYVPSECPDLKPDSYTGELPLHRCAVLHTRPYTKEMLRDVADEAEARAFMAGAPHGCFNWRLDTVPLEAEE